MADVYINRISSFLPNNPVPNSDMEDYLGFINGGKSKSKNIVLRNNGIEQRYYAMDKNGIATHSNAELAAIAIRKLFDTPDEIGEIELLACGTTNPDILLPSHAVMIHGLLKEASSIEVISNSGACCSAMQSFKHAYLSVKADDKKKVVCCGSERFSTLMRANSFKEEVEHLKRMEQNTYIAFEKDFLRWMLSDGAGAFLIENKKNEVGLSLRVEWIEICSFANELETCMYMGADKDSDGNIVAYQDMSMQEIVQKSVLSLKQDVKLLSENIINKGFEFLCNLLHSKGIKVDDIDYFLPHISSYFFKPKVYDILEKNGMPIPYERWFMNLKTKGNVGAGSIYLMLEELFNGGKLKKGDKILLAVPESARFSYAFSYLTVC
ncbi:MAG: beta-ketoacyl-ACP synthase III [Prolixibacteraceae bacterium]|nr:beta-ketoacyl-ACP synthase III [Prolixibacteraceae bacterium]